MSSLDIYLEVHQDSSMEKRDLLLAQLVHLTGTIPQESRPNSDGTNAGAFLSIQLAHEIHKLKEKFGVNVNEIWLKVCEIADQVQTQREINEESDYYIISLLHVQLILMHSV